MIDLKKQKIALSNLTDLNWLKQSFFSDLGQKMELKKGDQIIAQGELNDKLFYVEKGMASGYFKPDDGEEFKVFSTGTNMIVGIYSFFSNENRSYTTVKFDEDTTVYFVRKDQIPPRESEAYCLFLEHMLPVIVNEIYLRQMLMINSVSDKENVLKKLFESEKMATLGQLAAGLAHELNNAASVIQSKTHWITDHMKDYIREKDSKGLYPYFLKSLENGQELSTVSIRNRKQKIQELLHIREGAAKKLAKMNLTDEEIKQIGIVENQQLVDRLGYYWDAGLALHDINIAATHTTHVVQSIKELGAAGRKEAQLFSLRVSIKKAMSLLSGLLRKIDVTLEVDDEISFIGKEGDFIQVWVNLIKNAAESLNMSETKSPEIKITAEIKNELFIITISDNGRGIDEKTKNRIFQPSYTTKVSGLSFGLGLGLSIVQKIVTIYDGDVLLEDKDGWTSFIIQIPKK